MIRCPHCGLLHVSSRVVCPTTGLTIAASDAKPERRPERRTIRLPKQPPPTVERLVAGTVLDERYRVLGVIGQGGMGTVLEAEHLNIGRKVALKILKPEHAQKKEAIARMNHEARVVSQIGHPNICEIIDIGELADGSPYLVMERLRGETLAQRIERMGPQTLRDLADIMTQVLTALDAAHRKNVIHRDMKPDNIFLSERPSGKTVKILDFGISKATGPEEIPHHLTRPGMVMGTPYYMAPEQAMGERTLDGRVDVWGVAVAMYEALTGIRPFVARNYNALLVQILTVSPRPILELRPDLPPAFGEVMKIALEKRRESRYPTATAFSEALAPFRTPARTNPPRRAAPAPQSAAQEAPAQQRPNRSFSTEGTVPRPRSGGTVPPAQAVGSRSGIGPAGGGREALPKLFTTLEDNSSSFSAADEEPTHEIEARARKTFLNEEPSSNEDETPTIEENDPTIVDQPSFVNELLAERRRR